MKSTNKELVTELQKLNAKGNYDQLITNAKGNRYHDFKAPDEVVTPKVDLINDLMHYPELVDIRRDVINGVYDEDMDDDDMDEMRRDTPESMWPTLGL